MSVNEFSYQSQGDVKAKITMYTDAYKDVFKAEYEMFLKAQKAKVSGLREYNKHAKLNGTDYIERQLGEMPETLFTILEKQLTGDELRWFSTKDGKRWFFTRFPEFAVAGGKL